MRCCISGITRLLVISILLLIAGYPSLSAESRGGSDDPLSSWNDCAARRDIIDFVDAVTDESGPDYVDPAERVAVFDNDGTLWSERPLYFQLFFVIDQVKELAAQHPEWRTRQPFKAVLEDDMNALMEAGEKGLLELLMATHAGNTTEEFAGIVSEWIADAKHPRFERPYTALVFQPMLELLSYLRDRDFKIFIVSGGGIEFMRVWTEEIYGIPKENVIGSSIKTEYEIRGVGPVLVRLPEIDFIDDKEGKPVGINRFIGRRPIAAFGNSDGDLEMLQWTDAGGGRRLLVLIHHTDAEREWAYDRDSHIGRLDQALDEAGEKGWTVVDMKNDWKRIYPFGTE
jgi:phosphoserine phosphatase